MQPRHSLSQSLSHSVCQPPSQGSMSGGLSIRPFQVKSLEVKIFALMALFYIIAVTLYKFIQLHAGM